MKDNNILIAEFMGIELDTESYRCGSKMTYENWLIHSTQKNMRFHESWDWLMPVVKKCFDTRQLLLISNESFLTMDIDVVYDRVVEFIKAYNYER